MTEGELSIDLKGTTVEILEPTSWLAKFFQKFTGPKEVEVEVATQLQYLEKISTVLKSVGMTNVSLLELNGRIVYNDDEDKEDDLEEAISMALESEPNAIYQVQIEMDADVEDDESSIVINMYSQHSKGDIPLIINVDWGKTEEETTKFLEDLKAKINEEFGIESGDIDVIPDDDDDDDDEDEVPVDEEVILAVADEEPAVDDVTPVKKEE